MRGNCQGTASGSSVTYAEDFIRKQMGWDAESAGCALSMDSVIQPSESCGHVQLPL
jgi:hypothetical protein